MTQMGDPSRATISRCRGLRRLSLQIDHFAVATAGLHELLVGSDFYDLAIAQYNDPVGVRDRA